jgi:hypothetical protein
LQLDLEANSGYFADDANTIRVGGFALISVTVGLRRSLRVVSGIAASGFFTIGIHTIAITRRRFI